MSPSGVIYVGLCKKTGKRYVGLSRNWHNRIKQHIRFSEDNGQSHLAKDLRKYPNDFTWKKLQKFSNPESGKTLERKWAGVLDTYWPNGYNKAKCGGGWGWFEPEKVKEKIRKFRIGRRHSEKTKLKISKNKKGQKYGQCSKDHKLKHSKSATEQWKDPKIKKKMQKAMKIAWKRRKLFQRRFHVK